MHATGFLGGNCQCDRLREDGGWGNAYADLIFKRQCIHRVGVLRVGSVVQEWTAMP